MENLTWPGVTAVITAGGQSRRFGSDKARALLGGMTLLERVALSLAPAERRLLIAARGRYQLPGWETLPDERPGEGPLAGLETALKCARTPWVALAGVDSPLLTPAYWQRLLAARTGLLPVPQRKPEGKTERKAEESNPRAAPGVQAVAALHPVYGAQPLGALYHVSLLPAITALLDSGERRLKRAAPRGRTALVSGLPEHFFVNVNTPGDLSGLAPCPAEP